MTDVENNEISIRSLMNAKTMSKSMAQRIQDADKDHNGTLSMEEVIEIMQSEQDAVKERRLFLRIMIGMAVGLVLLAAAVAGMTYGIVELSKDVNDDNGVLTSKDSGAPMATGDAVAFDGLLSMYNVTEPDELFGTYEIVVGNDDGVGFTLHQVASISVTPGVSATVSTVSGESIIIDADGLRNAKESTEQAARRRLLGCNAFCRAGRRARKALSPVVNTVTNTVLQVTTVVKKTLNDIAAGTTYTIGQIKTYMETGFSEVGTAAAGLATVVTDFTSLLSSCSTWADIPANNPCCGPASQLSPIVTMLETKYNSVYSSYTGINDLGECFVTFKGVNNTLNNATTMLSAITGGAPASTFFGGIKTAITGVATTCSTCCNNIKTLTQSLNVTMDKNIGLLDGINTKCIEIITLLTAS